MPKQRDRQSRNLDSKIKDGLLMVGGLGGHGGRTGREGNSSD